MAAELPSSDDHISLRNSDLRPVKKEQRNATKWDMASLWIGLVTSIPNFYVAGTLVELGMSWCQGLATIVAANAILLVPLLVNAHAGTRYGIPFPVLARAAFGVHGAHIPTLLRALVACGWFGIETWIGGQAISLLLLPAALHSSPPISWLGISVPDLLCYLLFWAVQLVIMRKGMKGIEALEKYSAPVLILLLVSLLIWAYCAAGGFGEMLSLPSRLSYSQFWALFLPSLTANIGMWSTVSLNIPDFSRYAKSQSDQIVGQIGFPLFVGLFALVGLAVASSTQVIFGRVISNPIFVLAEIHGGLFITLLSIFGVGLAVVTTNVAANLVAPANALVALCPSVFDFWRGALVTAVLGLLWQPWRLYQSGETLAFTWLVGYSALLGPIGGILLVDYCVLRRMVLDVASLYSYNPLGAYYYHRGYNLAALAALLLGALPVVPGLLHELGLVKEIPRLLIFLYNISWFVTFFSAGVIYWVLSRLIGTIRSTQPMEWLLTESG